MGWASRYIIKLNDGQTVQFRPRGNSMTGRVENGQLVTVEPIVDTASLEVDEVVLCSVKGHHYLHIIKAKRGKQFLIGNNRGGVNGWIGSGAVYGRMVIEAQQEVTHE